jgi:ferredoxin
MALMIVAENCIGCAACEPECPNKAIFDAKTGVFFIEPDKCTECVGFHDEPRCAAVCPVADTCILDPDHQESQEALMAKKFRLEQSGSHATVH